MPFLLRRAFRTIVLLAGLSALVLHAQEAKLERHTRPQPAGTAELAAIAERGRAIAAYDQAAWHATDAVEALHPRKETMGMYIGRQTTAGWVIAFGKLNQSRDAFLMSYEVTPADDPLHPNVRTNDPATEERGEWLSIARAFELSRSQLHPQGRPYNGAVLHATEGEWYVYFYPGSTSNDVFPTGADTRFRVSADGNTIKETHVMHASYLEFKKSSPGDTTAMWFRTAFLDDAPEDTDVANTLMMGGVRGLIAAPTFVYQIAADGTPTYVQRTKDMMKELKKK